MRAARFMLPLLFLLCMPLIGNAAGTSKIVAVVNGVNLYEADLNQEINLLMPMNQPFHGKISEEKMGKIRSEALKNLIDSELMAQDARTSGMKISPAVVKSEWDKIEANFKSKEGLTTAYKNAGFTEESFLLALERRILVGKFRTVKVDDKVSVTPLTVKAYYEKNVSKFSKPEEFRVSVILLKVDPAATGEERSKVRDRAEKLLKAINDGAKFDDLAANESDDLSRIKGGDLGYFHAGQLASEIEDALVKLKIGGISPIVETLQGYLIVRLTDKRPPRQISFDEIKDKISKELVEIEKKQLLKEWMDGMHKKAVITYPGDK